MTLKSYEDLRMAFTSDVSMYDLEMSVFIDDTGADKDYFKKTWHGYNVRVKPAKSHELLC